MKVGEAYSPREAWPDRELPDWLLRRKHPSPGAKLCFAYLARFAGQDGPGLEEIGQALGVTGRQAASYVKDLKTAELVETERRGPHGCRYVFLWPHDAEGKEMQDTSSLSAPEEVKFTSSLSEEGKDASSLCPREMQDTSSLSPGEVKDTSSLGAALSRANLSKGSDPSSDSEPSPSIISPKQPSTPNPEPFWKEFLTAYPPRKGDRCIAKGREKFAALLKGGRDPQAILAGARGYRAHCDAEGKTGTEFVKQIPTWLNNRSWEEYPEVAPPPAGVRFAAAVNGRPRPDPEERSIRRAALLRAAARGQDGDFFEGCEAFGAWLEGLGWEPADAGREVAALAAEVRAEARSLKGSDHGRFAERDRRPGPADVEPAPSGG